MSEFGQRIGVVQLDGDPMHRGGDAIERFRVGRLLFDTAIDGVLAGAGHERRVAVEQNEDGDIRTALYAEPPISSPAKAQRLGDRIAELVKRTRANFPGAPFDICRAPA